MGGLRCDTEKLKESFGEDVLSVSDKRFDLTFYTPTARQLSCKVRKSKRTKEYQNNSH